MPPTNVPTTIPNSAHPWKSEAPVQLSIRPQIGAVMPPSAIDHKVTATVKVKMPTGQRDDAVDDALPERRVAEHRLDSRPPPLDLARAARTGRRCPCRATPWRSRSLDCGHHSDELQGREQHDQPDQREGDQPHPQGDAGHDDREPGDPQGQVDQEVERLLPGASLDEGTEEAEHGQRPTSTTSRCAGTSSSSGLGNIRAGTLDLQAGQHSVGPAGQPPVAVAEQLHRCGHQDHPHERRIDEHRDRQPEADQLDRPDVGHDEAAEHTDHDRSRSGDDPGCRRQALHDSGAVVARAVVLLTDGREQEDLVVHRQAEDDGEEHHRSPGLDGRARIDTEHAAEPSPLEDHHHHAVGGADRQQVHDDGLERHEHAAEDDEQQHEAQQEHTADEPRQSAGEDRREVDADRGLPSDVDVVGQVADAGRARGARSPPIAVTSSGTR